MKWITNRLIKLLEPWVRQLVGEIVEDGVPRYDSKQPLQVTDEQFNHILVALADGTIKTDQRIDRIIDKLNAASVAYVEKIPAIELGYRELTQKYDAMCEYNAHWRPEAKVVYE